MCDCEACGFGARADSLNALLFEGGFVPGLDSTEEIVGDRSLLAFVEVCKGLRGAGTFRLLGIGTEETRGLGSGCGCEFGRRRALVLAGIEISSGSVEAVTSASFTPERAARTVPTFPFVFEIVFTVVFTVAISIAFPIALLPLLSLCRLFLGGIIKEEDPHSFESLRFRATSTESPMYAFSILMAPSGDLNSTLI